VTDTNGRRRWLAAALAALVVAGCVLTAYRVLAPAEVSNVSIAAWPSAPDPHARLIGRYSAAPLFVDDRVRVYAAKRQVRADNPVDGETQNTPRWSFRRWPAQVTAVAAVGETVVTRWSDGELVALGARDGRVAWRLAGPAGGTYTGRRTGASVVWSPVGLYPSGDTVLALAGGRLRAVEARTGTVRWEVSVPGECSDGFTSAAGLFHCSATGTTYSSAGKELTGWPGGPFVKLGCHLSGPCAGLRDASGRAWLIRGDAPVRAPALDPADTALDVTGRLALPTVDATAITAVDPVTGAERWTWRITDGRTARFIASQEGTVHVLIGRDGLANLDAQTGTKRSELRLRIQWENDKWVPRRVYATDGFVTIERISMTAKETDDDHAYYLLEQNVIMAGTR
jgi:outer membrane protein assembly factor BamB